MSPEWMKSEARDRADDRARLRASRQANPALPPQPREVAALVPCGRCGFEEYLIGPRDVPPPATTVCGRCTWRPETRHVHGSDE